MTQNSSYHSEGREVEAEIGSWKYIDSLEEAFSHDSINYFEVGGVVTSNCTTKISFFVEFGADTSYYISEVRKAIHATIQICPNWFDLGNAEEKRMHKTEDIECHRVVATGISTRRWDTHSKIHRMKGRCCQDKVDHRGIVEQVQ